MFYRPKRLVLLTIIIFILPALACKLTGFGALPPTPTPVSTAEMQAMETQLYSAAATAVSGGKVHLEFTEGQLTAAANNELQKQGETRIQDIQIGLQGGLINVSGLVNQNGLQLPLSLSMKINVDSEGKPHTQVVSGQIGVFAIPESMLSQITAQFDQMLTSQLQAQGRQLFIESLTIDNGKISIVAQMK